MKLLYTPTSPYSRKVRVVAAELGVLLELEESQPHDADSLVARRNPLVKVPTLVTDDREVVYDSPVICELLDRQGDAPRLHGRDLHSWLAAMRLQALADGIMDATVAVRLESLRPETKRVDPIRQLEKVQRGVATLEELETTLRGEVSVGVIAAACALGYLDLRLESFNWRALAPQLAAWFATFSKRTSMRTTRHPAQ
jgi:glutathione S-transferase